MQNNSININKIKILVILFTILFPISTQAQLEWNNWIFDGYKVEFFNKNSYGFYFSNSINFNTKNGYLRDILFSSLSDKNNGNLIFSTNGTYIYDNKFELVKNGILEKKLKDDSLNFINNQTAGFDTFSESHIILPSLKKNIANLFTINFEDNPGLYNTTLLLDNEKIDIINKEVKILDNCIGLTAIYHKNKENLWLITYDYQNYNINVLLVGINGNIESINKISTSKEFKFENKVNNGKSFKMRINSIANKLAISFNINANNTLNSNVYIYDFDNNNGNLKYVNFLKLNSHGNQGLEFSPNSRYLYCVNQIDNAKYFELVQFDIFYVRNNQIPKIRKIYPKNNRFINLLGLANEYVRIGIDNKIYFNEASVLTSGFVINTPNIDLDFITIEEDKVPNLDNQIQHTFPLYPPEFDLKLYSNAPMCANSDTLKLYSSFSHSEIPDVSYEWTAPNGMTYTKDSIYIPNPNMSYSGKYYLRVKSNFLDVDMLDSIDVVLYPKPEYNLKMVGEPCGSAEITLKSDVEFPTTFKYLWNTGAITPELKVSKNGDYTLIVTDTNGCETSKSIEIIFGKKPIAEIKAMGATTFCEGSRVELRATGGMNSSDLNFEWNTGEKVPNIWVDKSGIYRVVITHKFSNCKDSAEIEIKVNPNLVSKVEQIGSLCKGGEVTLQATSQGTEYKYIWSNGETTPSIKVNQAGKYTVEVSLDGACKSSAEIEVIANQAQDFEILADGKFCIGEVVKLTSSKDFAEYLWSNGETTKEINVTLSGTYKLMVTDENGCTNEKSIDVKFISPREYKLDFTDYDFGNVEIGTEKRVKVNIPGEVQFSLRGDFPLDITTMEMLFKPEAEGDYSGEIVLNYGGDCDTSVTIIFKGRGVNSVKYFAKVIAPKVTTEAGLDNVELPIKFEINDENMTYPFELDYKIKLSLNYDVYIPQLPSNINGTKREIEITGKSQINKGENTLTSIIGKTYLSQDFENEIKILNFENNTDKLSVEQEDGYLNITGICVPDLRGLNFFTPTTMTVSPNPVSSDLTIKINTEEIGQHKLRLVDITGNSREVGDFEVKELTEKVLKINAKELSKGQYFLELITPNQTITEKVVVE